MGFAGETASGAVPVGRDPARPLRRRLRPRPPGGHAGGRGRQQGQRPQRPPARAESVPGARAAVRAAPPRGAHPRGRQPRAQARRARRRPPPRPAARRPRRAPGALEPADAGADRAGVRDRQPRRERVHPPACATRACRYRARYAEGGTDVVVGYSVRLPGAERRSAAERVVRRRSARARPHAPGAAARLGPRRARRGGARSREWSVDRRRRGRGRRPSARPSSSSAALMWHRCTMELERVRQQLRAAGTDPAAIAHAAREGAGVLAAWSLALEGEQPGRARPRRPRSSRAPPSCPPTRRRRRKPLSRASGLALFMLAAGKPDSAGRLADRRARDRAARLRARSRAPRPRRARPRPADRDRARRRARADRGGARARAAAHRRGTSTPKRRPPSAPASRCRRRPGIPDAKARGRPRTSSGCSARCSGGGAGGGNDWGWQASITRRGWSNALVSSSRPPASTCAWLTAPAMSCSITASASAPGSQRRLRLTRSSAATQRTHSVE